jgi:citronellol/citronellal dehydrogenase
MTTLAGLTLLMSGGSRGNFFVDEEVLAQEGVTDLEGYRTLPGSNRLEADLFLEPLESDA